MIWYGNHNKGYIIVGFHISIGIGFHIYLVFLATKSLINWQCMIIVLYKELFDIDLP
jgi:hypothetical protein